MNPIKTPKLYKALSLALRGEEISIYDKLEEKGFKAKAIFLVGLEKLAHDNNLSTES